MMNRQVTTIFCDDIRHELGGKTSFIGVYAGVMFVASFPVILPKFCLAASLVTPVDRPFRQLTLRVLKDSEVLVEGSLEESELSRFTESAEEGSAEDRMDRVAVMQSLFVFSPFKIDSPCGIRVRVDTEDGELRGVGLRIEQAPIETEAADAEGI